jgi:hypothetical protein
VTAPVGDAQEVRPMEIVTLDATRVPFRLGVDRSAAA